MKLEVSMPKVTRRQFTDAFKSEAVRLTRESGRPVAQVARELGISDKVLYRWRTEQQQVEAHFILVRHGSVMMCPPGLSSPSPHSAITCAISSSRCAARP